MDRDTDSFVNSLTKLLIFTIYLMARFEYIWKLFIVYDRSLKKNYIDHKWSLVFVYIRRGSPLWYYNDVITEISPQNLW